jgi:integrase
MGRKKKIDTEMDPAVKLIEPGSGHSCARQQPRYCVQMRYQDGTKVHSHFPEGHLAQANQRARDVRAAAHAPGKSLESDQSKKRLMTWEEYATGVFEANIKDDLSDPDTAWQALKRTFRPFGTTLMMNVSGESLGKLQSDLKTKPYRGKRVYAVGTVALTMIYVNRVARQAIADRVIDIDASALPKGPVRQKGGGRRKVRAVARKEVPTVKEMHAIVDGTPDFWRLAVMLGVYCGMRIGEILGLRPWDVDLDAGVINIVEQQQRRGRVSPKTANGIREIKVPRNVLAELRRRIHPWAPVMTPVFTGPRGGDPRRDEFYKQAWKPALRAADIADDRYVFHATRHYCVSKMLEGGIPPHVVAKYVGDEPSTINEVYAQWTTDSEVAPHEAMDAVMERSEELADVVPLVLMSNSD